MLAKSSKSRFAAIAIMSLGVSTFMGTSAALATDVTVSGTVGACAAFSSVTASDADFGTVEKDTEGSTVITPTVIDGQNEDCSSRDSVVTAEITDLSGGAATAVTELNRVVVTIGALNAGAFPMTADVPVGAAVGAFGATVTLTLSDND